MNADRNHKTRVLALSGGVGGAKMAQALLEVISDPKHLCVVCNTGDDFVHLGLHISPDVDSVMYRLAGLHDEERGWGRHGETWRCLEALGALGGETWFQLGDRDLATHLERTQRLASGASLSEATGDLCSALGIACQVVPMSDDLVRTLVHTDQGVLEFQHYFVKQRCAPRVKRFQFQGIQDAEIGPDCARALTSPELDLVVMCPSNPYVSMDPILGLPCFEKKLHALIERGVRVVAISPIIGGQALKGPAAKMMAELELESSALNVARHYMQRGLLTDFLIDPTDMSQQAAIEELGLSVMVVPALLDSIEARSRVATEVLALVPSS